MKEYLMIRITDGLRCAACGEPAFYVRPIDRYVHADGRLNDECWLRYTQGRIDWSISGRNDQAVARSHDDVAA
jgi:hypothetical protein